MGYTNYNNNGSKIKRLMEKSKIIHMGPDFRTFVHKNGRAHIVFPNRNAFLNYAIERGSLTTSDHFPVILKLSMKPIVRRVERGRCMRKTNWDAFKGKMEARVNAAFNLAELENREDIDADMLEDLYKWWY